MNNNIQIAICSEHGGSRAEIPGEPGFWGQGGTPAEAIGDMIACAPERFGIEIRYPEKEEVKAVETAEVAA